MRVFLLVMILILQGCNQEYKPEHCIYTKGEVLNYQNTQEKDGVKYYCGKSKGYYCVRVCG